jgi:hypothetical protein
MGSHTLSLDTSETCTGSVIEPFAPVTVINSGCPNCSNIPALTTATDGRAVAAKCGSPSCITPESISSRQVAKVVHRHLGYHHGRHSGSEDGTHRVVQSALGDRDIHHALVLLQKAHIL